MEGSAEHGRMNYEIDLLTDIAALCLTDFIDWRYIHSVVCIFDPACELLPPWTKEQNNTCVLLPLYLTFSLTSPLPKLKVLYTGGMMNCAVDHIPQEFYTLFLARFGTYKIATPPQTNDQ